MVVIVVAAAAAAAAVAVVAAAAAVAAVAAVEMVGGGHGVMVKVERTHHSEMPARTPLRCSSAFPMGEVRGGARRSTSPTALLI